MNIKRFVSTCVAARLKKQLVSFVLAVMITGGVYAFIHRFTNPGKATRWLPLYDRIYNTPDK